jgi:hypothetical protein
MAVNKKIRHIDASKGLQRRLMWRIYLKGQL